MQLPGLGAMYKSCDMLFTFITNLFAKRICTQFVNIYLLKYDIIVFVYARYFG